MLRLIKIQVASFCLFISSILSNGLPFALLVIVQYFLELVLSLFSPYCFVVFF